MAENKLFRKTALDTVSNPEQLDQHIRVTKPFSWVILIAIVSFTIGVGIWAFTGNISSGTDVTGIVFASDGVSVANAVSYGIVSDVLVSENEQVDKGDVMVVIPDEELLAQIKEVKAQYDAVGGDAKSSIETTLDALKYQYIINSFVSANKTGTINSVPAIGDSIAEGQQVTVNYSEESMSGSKELIAYVPYSVAQSFKVGGDVQISPSSYPREEYGYMLGKITSIGSTLVTEESIQRTMGTTKYISPLGVTPDCVEVKIRPNVDSSTKSGFEWSNSKGGQNVSVDIGTMCKVKVVSEAVHPINLFIK